MHPIWLMLSNQIMDEIQTQYLSSVFISDGAQGHSGETVFLLREQKDMGQLFSLMIISCYYCC